MCEPLENTINSSIEINLTRSPRIDDDVMLSRWEGSWVSDSPPERDRAILTSHRPWLVRALSLGLVLFGFVAASNVGLAQGPELHLTQVGIDRGFLPITTFASGFPSTSGVGPIGIAYVTDAITKERKVLVTAHDSGGAGDTIYLFPSHMDGQTSLFPVAHYSLNHAVGLAQIQFGTEWKYYLGQFAAHQIIEIDGNGTAGPVVAILPAAPLGMAPYPPYAAVGPLTGHLFVTDTSNSIWDVDPSLPPPTNITPFKLSAGNPPDGLTFSQDGSTLYVAFADNVVRAYDTASTNLIWTSPVIPGPDGIATGLGTLTGYIYVNCTTGDLWELGVPGGPHDGDVNHIATGGSRGDFIAVDTNVWSGGSHSFPSLLLTQTDRIMRLDPPGGGFFGPPTSSTDPVLCLTCFPRLCEPELGAVIACPCSNSSTGPARGCNNHGTVSGGAALEGSGNPSITSDGVLLSAMDENASALTVFWTGSILLAPPGVAHAAGVRCVSGLHRLYRGSASGGAITRPDAGDPTSVSARSAAVGAPITAGQTRYYFTIYRDPQAATPCGITSSTVNLSNAVSVLWGP